MPLSSAGWTPRTQGEIAAAVAVRLGGFLGITVPVSDAADPLARLVQAFAAELADLELSIAAAFSAHNPASQSGAQLDRILASFGTRRRAERAATVRVRLAGTPTLNLAGLVAADPDGGLWINLLPITVPWPRPSDSRTVHTQRFGAEATETTQTRVGLASSPFTPLIGWSGGPVLARPAGTEILPFETLSLRGTGRTRVGAAGDLNVCQGPPGDNTFFLPVLPFMPAWAQTAYARLEVIDEGTCVRGLEQGRGREQVVVTAENGALVGWNGEGVEISCRVRGD